MINKFITDKTKIYLVYKVDGHIYRGTCKVRNEIETKRNRTKRNEIKQNETKQNRSKRNVTNKNEKFNMA
jgi:hypothetical protein